MNLPCGDVFCEECLVRLSRTESLRCPIHKEKFALQVKDLSPALTIFKFLTQSNTKDFTCTAHRKKVKYRCRADNKYLCRVCVLEHTGAGHSLENFTATMQNVKAQSDDIRKMLARKSTSLQELKKSIDSEERKIKSHCEVQIRSVNSVYDEAVCQLNTKRRELVAVLKENLNRQIQVIEGEKGRIGKQMEVMNGVMVRVGRVNWEGQIEDIMRGIEAAQSEVKAVEEGRPLDLPLYTFENGVKVSDLSCITTKPKSSSKSRNHAWETIPGKFWICKECSMPNSSDMSSCYHCSPRKPENTDFSRSLGYAPSPKSMHSPDLNLGFDSNKTTKVSDLTRKPSLKTVPIKADLQTMKAAEPPPLTRRARKHSRHLSLRKHNNSF